MNILPGIINSSRKPSDTVFWHINNIKSQPLCRLSAYSGERSKLFNELVEILEYYLNDPTAERGSVFDLYYPMARKLADIISNG